MTKQSVWDLIELGAFEDACKAADDESVRSDSILPLRNKIIALLNLEEYAQVVSLSQSIIERTNGNTDRDFVFLGLAHWFQDQYEVAIDVWQRATDTHYTDAAGGVEIQLLLHYASARHELPELKHSSIKSLQKLASEPAASNWPGPIARYLVGQHDETALREKLSKQPVLNAKQTCQAAFHIGITNLIDGDAPGFQERMREAGNQGPFSLLKPEHYLARWELRQKE